MNRNTARKAEHSRKLRKQRLDGHDSNPIQHGPNAFQHPHTAINRRAKEHPNSWRVKMSKAVKQSA